MTLTLNKRLLSYATAVFVAVVVFFAAVAIFWWLLVGGEQTTPRLIGWFVLLFGGISTIPALFAWAAAMTFFLWAGLIPPPSGAVSRTPTESATNGIDLEKLAAGDGVVELHPEYSDEMIAGIIRDAIHAANGKEFRVATLPFLAYPFGSGTLTQEQWDGVVEFAENARGCAPGGGAV